MELVQDGSAEYLCRMLPRIARQAVSGPDRYWFHGSSNRSLSSEWSSRTCICARAKRQTTLYLRACQKADNQDDVDVIYKKPA